MKRFTFADIIGANGIFIDGDWIESKDQDQNGDVRLIQLADIGDGYFVDKSKRFLTSKKAKELRCTYLQKGDVLVARMPDPLGRACIFPDVGMPCITVVDVCIIRPSPEIIYSPYLKYLINSPDFRNRINQYITGTTRQRISRSNLSKINFYIPSIEDQKRIVKILDTADALHQKRKQTITLFDSYLQSVFLEMFGDPIKNPKGWNVDTIDAVCDEIVDCVNRTAPIVTYPTEYRMIRTSNIRNYKINFDDTRYASEAIYNKWTRRLVPQKDDIIFTREAPLGEAAIIDFDKKVFLGQRTMQFRPNKLKINPIFLLFQLMGPYLKQQMSKLSSGSTVKHLSVPACKKFKILIPPVETQNLFAEVFGKVEKLKQKMLIQAEELETQFQALMQKAFKGEL